MKKIGFLSLLVLSSLFFCLSGNAKTTQSLDQIMAVVNDDVITKYEFNRALFRAKMQMTQESAPIPPDNVLHKQVIDQLINRKLQLQMAQFAGIQVKDVELNQAIERVAKQNNLSVDALYERISQDGMPTAEYRDEIRDQMTIQKLQQQEVIGKISVSQIEVNNFIRSKMWQNYGLKEYHIEDMLIPLSEAPSTEEITSAKKLAQSLLAKIQPGQGFKDLPQQEANNNIQSGDLGWRKLPEIPSAFAEKVARMQPKEIAGPIQTPNGFHLIHLVDVRRIGSEGAPSRKQVEELLLQRKFDEAVQTWVSKLRNQAFIEANVDKK